MNFRSTLLALSVIAAPSAVLAQPIAGPYVSLGAGVDYLQDQNIRSSNIAGIGQVITGGQTRSDLGGVGTASVGWGFGNGFRAELQGDYRETKLYSINGASSSGFTEQFGGFVNGLYDFDLSGSGTPNVVPFLGAGVGYEVNHLRNVHLDGIDGAGNPVLFRTTGSKGDFAIQAIAGFAYNIPEVPGLALTAEYRFTAMPSDLTHDGQYLTACCSSRITTKVDGSYNHQGIVGIRYALWAPEVAPVPEAVAPIATPPVTAARTYLVFFDWDRADLSPRAREIVGQAAAASTHVQTTKIEVNGYTDLSGTAAYNQKLSVRRAKAVEAELVKDGVAQAAIDIHGYGESNPLVPTAKGVREPQNRRVEIILK